jgi:hypothetical protein
MRTGLAPSCFRRMSAQPEQDPGPMDLALLHEQVREGPQSEYDS